MQNYRPISLLPCPSKILKKVIKNRLITFFLKHKIIYDYQYGFKEKHSVIHALLDVLSFRYDAIQKKRHYLGVIVDNKLNFKTHFHYVENKVSRSVGILFKLQFLFPSLTLLQLYYALAHPHLLYGLLLWGCTLPSYLLSKLQSLQNKAVRIIFDFKFKAPLTPQFKNWQYSKSLIYKTLN